MNNTKIKTNGRLKLRCQTHTHDACLHTQFFPFEFGHTLMIINHGMPLLLDNQKQTNLRSTQGQRTFSNLKLAFCHPDSLSNPSQHVSSHSHIFRIRCVIHNNHLNRNNTRNTFHFLPYILPKRLPYTQCLTKKHRMTKITNYNIRDHRLPPFT